MNSAPNMAASRINSSSGRICRRYKLFFYMCFMVLCLQLLIGYNFYSANQLELEKIHRWKSNIDDKLKNLTPVLDVKTTPNLKEDNVKRGYSPKVDPTKSVNIQSLIRKTKEIKKQVEVTCPTVEAKETLSALARAQTEQCKLEITRVECLNQKGMLYPKVLPNLCHRKGRHERGKYIGCFKDNMQDRDLGSTNEVFSVDNSPQKCIDFCTTGGYLYAGLQYQKECWCGKTYGKHGFLPESTCNTACPGNQSHTCGGFNAQRIFSTGLADKYYIKADLDFDVSAVKDKTPVRIVFVLTVHGRAVRQVRRLINSIYKSSHYYYIHVDSRSAYMYRELLKLEDHLPNVRLARDRYATIWGGASLLEAHLSFMEALLAMTDWHWDYYINLSESDYPVNTISKLTQYLTHYRGNNFLKGNGRDTYMFIKKQGLEYTFYECDNHLWRLGRRELPKGILMDGGSDWIILYRDFCDYTIKANDTLLTGLKTVFKYSLLPVESFFHTLIHNSQFCERWVDSNLHLTNWKRKQGCKCQHKNQVDWCGCSPNNLKPDDMDKIMKSRSKAVFFARKFEAIVSQDIINSLDAELGRDLIDMPGLDHYWENAYHHLDPLNSMTDVLLTQANSLARTVGNIFRKPMPKCAFNNITVLETNLLYVADSFHRYLVLYNVNMPGSPHPVTFESQFSQIHHYKILDPRGPIGRLKNLEVGTDFDPKELLFRNYGGFLGPHSQVGLRHEWGQGPAITITTAWIDPAGVIAAYEDINIPPDAHIGNQKLQLKTPLRPGLWTIKVLNRLDICGEVNFVVLPYSVYKGKAISKEEAISLHNGPGGLYTQNYTDLSTRLGVHNAEKLLKLSVINGMKTGEELSSWVDELSEKRWTMQDTCSTVDLGGDCPPLELCKNTRWSSLSPDPKSDIIINQR